MRTTALLPISLLWVGVALLCFTTVATFCARLWWGFELFSHFRVHYVVLSALLIPTALLLRCRSAALAAALLGLPHWLAVAGLVRLMPLAEAAATGSPGVTLTTLNLLHSNTEQREVFAYVASVDPDILILQEADRNWIGRLDPLARRYPHAAPANWRDGTDVIVFSKLPIRRWDAPSPRIVAATLDLGSGSIDVVGVHARIPSSAEDAAERAADYGEVATRATKAQGPFVAAGDFNSTNWSPMFEDLLVRSGLAPAGSPSLAPTWQCPGVWPLALPIDHVLARNGLTTVSRQRGPDVGSDHRPLTVRFELRQ